ncbi:MAG TPA: hypothetical protein VNO54_22780 [Streptosporangiaceae bacterium]|nr:hypothetical protein [Streptosporangiaceae bacterium]
MQTDADTLVFLRETEHEALVIAATRTERGPLALPLDAPLAGVYGADDVTPVDGRVTLDAAPAALRIWRFGRDQH